ncbi:MAG TPA: hypothetical protein VIQ24_02370 [Pyrinomonadaceae bacterium]
MTYIYPAFDLEASAARVSFICPADRELKTRRGKFAYRFFLAHAGGVDLH